MMVDHYRYINCCRWLWIPSCRSMNCRLLTTKSRSLQKMYSECFCNLKCYFASQQLKKNIMWRKSAGPLINEWMWDWNLHNHQWRPDMILNWAATWPDSPTLQGFVHSVWDPKTKTPKLTFCLAKWGSPKTHSFSKKWMWSWWETKRLMSLQVCKSSIFLGGWQSHM